MSVLLILALLGANRPATVVGADLELSLDRPATRIDLYVFKAGLPLADVEVRVNGDRAGRSDENGGLVTVIPSGRVLLELFSNDERVTSLDLLTDKGELVQIIVGLRDGEPPEIEIESTGKDSVLAGERKVRDPSQKRPEDLPPGALVGTVISIGDQAAVAGAQIFFSGVARQAETDDAGYFEGELPAGTYSLSVIHPRYSTQTLDNIRVIPGKKVTLNIELTPVGVRLQDYIVTAPYVEGSIASMIEQQRTTSNVTEVLGADQMSAAGDSNAAEALQRVTGLTVEENKFVLVRGQPSRYTLTLWNGSPLPSPEPLKRVVPLDLFPTGVLSNIVIQKSYSPDKPGSFGAGLVDLVTRGVPDEAFGEIKLSGGYNSQSTFDSGLTYDGGALDIFGYDDGTRQRPGAVAAATEEGRRTLQGQPSGVVNQLGREFSNAYEVDAFEAPPDFALSLAGGGSEDVFLGGTIGAVGSIKWSRRWRQQDRIQRVFSLDQQEVLQIQNDLREDRTDLNVDLGGLLTVEGKWDRINIASNTLYVHQTQQRTQIRTGLRGTSDRQEVEEFLLGWLERQLVAQQVKLQASPSELLQVELRGLFARADRDSPDRRELVRIRRPPNPKFFWDEGTGARRRFNVVDDTVVSFGGDLSVPLLVDEEGKNEHWFEFLFKTGVAARLQERESITELFQWRPDDETIVDLAEPRVSVVYDPNNTGSTLVFRDFNLESGDDYIGTARVWGVYAMTDVKLGEFLRIVGGVRGEGSRFVVTSFTAADEGSEGRTAEFDEFDILPSVSLTWFATEDMQVRFAYARTVSRPMLNEMSDVPFFDPDTAAEFRGAGVDEQGRTRLRPARIDGGDLRWEWYPTTTESLMIGGFIKSYSNPIERTFVARGGGNEPVGSFANAKGALVIGGEASARFELERFRRWLGGPGWIDHFYLQANCSVMKSEVQLETAGIGTSDVRQLDGQADFVVNVQGGYDGDALNVTVAFNQVGQRLFRAGTFGQPDVVLQTIPTLDATISWDIWNEGTLKLSGSNLLNPSIDFVQGSEVWRSFRRGLGVGASFAWRFY